MIFKEDSVGFFLLITIFQWIAFFQISPVFENRHWLPLLPALGNIYIYIWLRAITRQLNHLIDRTFEKRNHSSWREMSSSYCKEKYTEKPSDPYLVNVLLQRNWQMMFVTLHDVTCDFWCVCGQKYRIRIV